MKAKFIPPCCGLSAKVPRPSIVLSSLRLNCVLFVQKKKLKKDAERMGMLPAERVIFQILFRSFVRKLMPLCPLAHKSPVFFLDFFLFLLYFPLNLRAQPFQITKQIKETDSSLSRTASLPPPPLSSSPLLTAFQLCPSLCLLYFYPRCSNSALAGKANRSFCRAQGGVRQRFQVKIMLKPNTGINCPAEHLIFRLKASRLSFVLLGLNRR